VHLHPNAKLTPHARRLLVDRVERLSWSVARAAREAGVSRQTVHKWLNRFREGGDESLEDRSSRPKHLPTRTPQKLIRRMVQLRRRRKAGWEIAQELDMAVATVSKHLKAEGLGHRIHGDRSQKHRGAGYEVVFVCVDDHTRLAYAEVLPSENAKYATAFFRRALKWFRSLGIRCRRVLSDNHKCYGSNDFTALCQAEGVRQSFTRPYTPKTNGKAERFIQTMKRRWAYRYVFRSSAMRAASLRPWVTHYNHRRPHRSLGKKPPMERLRETRQQRA